MTHNLRGEEEETHDLQGRPWLTVQEAKEGALIEHDNGSPCWTKPQYTLLREEDNELYFQCAEGRHGLDGQLDDPTGTFYIGLYSAAKPQDLQKRLEKEAMTGNLEHRIELLGLSLTASFDYRAIEKARPPLRFEPEPGSPMEFELELVGLRKEKEKLDLPSWLKEAIEQWLYEDEEVYLKIEEDIS